MLLCAVLVGWATASYLCTVGHCFLPIPKPTNFEGQTMQIRTYAPLKKPPNSGPLARLGFQITRPGQARLLSLGGEMAKTSVNYDTGLQKVQERLGYSFPQGCWAGTRGGALMIQHYPSMLDRIQKDMHLSLASADPDPAVEQVADPGGATNRSQPVRPDTNQPTAGAGSAHSAPNKSSGGAPCL